MVKKSVFYVAPEGSDKNSGISPLEPFQTLERAQLAMQESNASKKIAYLMNGEYKIKNTLKLTSKDNGEYWLAYPGHVPVLDGNNIIEKAITIINGDSIKIRWLTIQNFTRTGIYSENSNNIFIDSNIIRNISSNGWNQGGVVSVHSFTNSTVSHNFVENSGYSGIMSAGNGGDISNLTIDNNKINNVCIDVNDCGAIYINDRSHNSKNIKITNNIIKDYGTKATPKSWAIYLDDQMSNSLVKNNIAYGNGEWAFMIHGGDHNIAQNNIFDISNNKGLGYYAKIGNRAKDYGMEDNKFFCNIIYSSSTLPTSLWKVIGHNPKPDVYNNLYWSREEKESAISNSGDIIDRNATFKDPEFIDPANGNYNFRDVRNLSFCESFKPINIKNVGPLPNLPASSSGN